jgi:hypothetical protein
MGTFGFEEVNLKSHKTWKFGESFERSATSVNA